ncbi:MAG TPA: hypothetical protein VJ997_00920 [Longimicrobiales bacterium]|nr:hypothetical protein [Longimicrobiales bacterium]
MTTKMKKMMRGAAAAATGMLLVAPSGVSAQEQIGCFRGKPLPDCKTFWIVEMQGLIPMAQTTRRVTSGSDDYRYTVEVKAFENVVEWNVGHMVNVGEGYALGGIITVGTGGSDPLTGLRLRGRKWLNKDLSLELEAGLLRTDGGGSRFAGLSGWTSDLRLNIRDQGSFFVRYDGVSLPEQSYPFNSYLDPGGVHHGISLGASAGSVPALVATGALGIFYAVLVALYIGSD